MVVNSNSRQVSYARNLPSLRLKPWKIIGGTRDAGADAKSIRPNAGL